MIKKFIHFFLGNFFSMLMGMIALLLTAHFFSPAIYGSYSLYQGSMTVIALCMIFGGTNYYIRQYYTCEENNRDRLLKNCLWGALLILIGIIVVTVGWYPFFMKLVMGQSGILYYVLLMMSSFCYMIVQYATYTLRFEKHYTWAALLSGISKVGSTFFLLILFFLFSGKLMVLVLSLFLGYFTTTILFLFSYGRFKRLIRSPKMDSFSYWEMFRYSAPFFLSTIIFWVFSMMDRYFLLYFHGDSSVGIYSLAFRIIVFVDLFKNTILSFFEPWIYQAYEESQEACRKMITNMVTLCSYLFFIMGAGIMMVMPVMMFCVGPVYSASQGAMFFLLLIPISHGISELVAMGINFKKRTIRHTIIISIVVVLNAFFNFLLVPRWSYIGAAAATALAYICLLILRGIFSYPLFPVKLPIGKIILGYIFLFLTIAISLGSSSWQVKLFTPLIAAVGMTLLYSRSLFELWKARKK